MGDLMNGLEGLTVGDFKILTKIGSGAMGTVYLAQQPSLKRSVAVKVLLPTLASDLECARRFKREAMLAASLSHPNIVQVYAAGEQENIHYLVMEYVHGESLEKRITREGRILPEAALNIVVQMAEALDHAWSKARMIHRDVKPSNILLSAKGDVKLADFGLAKSSGGDSTLTGTGMFVGTPRYISPEQARGDDEVDFTADIYSLGCTLYHMLCGRAPFVADAPIAVVVQHLTKPIPSILEKVPDCPPPIVKLINRMTAKTPAKRPANYSVLIEEMRQAQASLVKPRKSAGLQFALAGILLIAGLGWYFATHRPVRIIEGPTQSTHASTPVAASPASDSRQPATAFAKEVAALPPETQAKRVIARIKELNRDFDPASASYSVENGTVSELTLSIVAVTDLSPVAALRSLKSLQLGQTGQTGALSNLDALSDLALTRLECHNCNISDLGPLRRMPLQWLVCSGSPRISDLTPVQGCPLEALGINDTAVTDLKPVRNMPLKYLNCGLTQIEDLTPLQGVPLTDLNCTHTRVRDLKPLVGKKITRLICSHAFVEDLTPLRGMPLKELDCDYDPTRDQQILRAIPTLEKINSLPVNEFWKNQ